MVPDQAVHANWEIVAAVDLNGDGYVDLLWHDGSTGKIVYWWMDASVQRITGSLTNPPNAGARVLPQWLALRSACRPPFFPASPAALSPSTALSASGPTPWTDSTRCCFAVLIPATVGSSISRSRPSDCDSGIYRRAGQFTSPDSMPVTPPESWAVAGPR